MRRNDGFGCLCEFFINLLKDGSIEVLGEERMDIRTVLHLIVTGADGFAIADVHRYELWLDMASLFPVKAISRDRRNADIEIVTMEALEVNATLPETMFNP